MYKMRQYKIIKGNFKSKNVDHEKKIYFIIIFTYSIY